MKKKEKKVEGAPDWMVTYGDMMTLLLCFFVIIVSMSEIKEEEKFQKVVESIQRAFGYAGGIGFVPTEVTPTNSQSKMLDFIVIQKAQLSQGKSSDDGIEGENPSVKMIRDGLQYTIGGRVAFETGKARLLDGVKSQIDEFVEIIKGYNFKIRVRGHAALKPPNMYPAYNSLDDLSYARAAAVKEYLIEKGIRGERITVEACGANEPLRTQAYDEESMALNRRVSIIVTESLVEDYQGAPTDMTEGTIR